MKDVWCFVIHTPSYSWNLWFCFQYQYVSPNRTHCIPSLLLTHWPLILLIVSHPDFIKKGRKWSVKHIIGCIDTLPNKKHWHKSHSLWSSKHHKEQSSPANKRSEQTSEKDIGKQCVVMLFSPQTHTDSSFFPFVSLFTHQNHYLLSVSLSHTSIGCSVFLTARTVWRERHVSKSNIFSPTLSSRSTRHREQVRNRIVEVKASSWCFWLMVRQQLETQKSRGMDASRQNNKQQATVTERTWETTEWKGQCFRSES